MIQALYYVEMGLKKNYQAEQAFLWDSWRWGTKEKSSPTEQISKQDGMQWFYWKFLDHWFQSLVNNNFDNNPVPIKGAFSAGV